MSNRNDATQGASMALLALGLVGIVLFVVGAFLALVLTVVALFALERPITILGHTITPRDATRFLVCGVIGAALAPAFVMFADSLLELGVDWSYWPYIVLGGYTLGSLGITALAEEMEEANGVTEQRLSTPPLPPPAAQRHAPKTPSRPFDFASWDDDEVR